MASHHFIGNGQLCPKFAAAAADRDALSMKVTDLVRSAGLEVVECHAVEFDNGGLTLVCVLAESHLVIHHWAEEGYATIDLHVCDYRQSNVAKASHLVRSLTGLCFQPGTESWNEIHLEEPSSAQHLCAVQP